jgi:CRISPR system Cascade subunit CasE
MYFSRVTLKLDRLSYPMQQKMQSAGSYALHQWLWQLFPNQDKRSFLFREEQTNKGRQYYLLSNVAPLAEHELFFVETKPYSPQLTSGLELIFSLRANPVVVKNGKRCDVMMNAKYIAKAEDKEKNLSSNDIKIYQNKAALDWLIRQGEKRGFALKQNDNQTINCAITSYNLNLLNKAKNLKPIRYSSVDFEGVLIVTDPKLFLETLYQGIGKSKGFGCGLFLIKRYQ